MPEIAARHVRVDIRNELAATDGLDRRRNVLLAQHHREQDWSIAHIARLLDRSPHRAP